MRHRFRLLALLACAATALALVPATATAFDRDLHLRLGQRPATERVGPLSGYSIHAHVRQGKRRLTEDINAAGCAATYRNIRAIVVVSFCGRGPMARITYVGVGRVTVHIDDEVRD